MKTSPPVPPSQQPTANSGVLHRRSASASAVLPSALGNTRRAFDSLAGQVAYYASDVSTGRPLLLIHSVNAAASAAEVRPLFEHYASKRPVYAMDLPGFGASERTSRDYTPRLMTDAVLAMKNEIARQHGGVAIDALALSLSCEYLARASTEDQFAFSSLAFVSPTGFESGDKRRGARCSSREIRLLHAVLKQRWLGPRLYRLLVRPRVIRYFLERTWGSKDIDETLLAYNVVTSHQPGAEHAPLAFLAAQPFSADANNIYDDVIRPVWLSHGVRGSSLDFTGAQHLIQSGVWSSSAFTTGDIPYFEVPRLFIQQYDAFMQRSALRQGMLPERRFAA
jgi:pimeloyl-ACP methyl ester carboxylesterase